LSRERVVVSLAPDAVAWVRLTGLLKPRAVAHGVVDADPDYGKDPWAGALAALALQAEAWRRERVTVAVVLSNHFVRYGLVAAPPRGVSREEELALARFHFAKLHGERAAAWDVRVTPGKRGRARVASAVDRALLAALQAIFDKPSRARLASVQPYLMCAFNRWRNRLGLHGGWLVLAEPGRICLAMLAGDAWGALQSARVDEASQDWLALLEREAQRAAVQPVPSTVFAQMGADAAGDSATHGPWNVVTLHPPSLDGIPDAERERYALALHAA
jgi:hypothetical protein